MNQLTVRLRKWKMSSYPGKTLKHRPDHQHSAANMDNSRKINVGKPKNLARKERERIGLAH